MPQPAYYQCHENWTVIYRQEANFAVAFRPFAVGFAQSVGHWLRRHRASRGRGCPEMAMAALKCCEFSVGQSPPNVPYAPTPFRLGFGLVVSFPAVVQENETWVEVFEVFPRGGRREQEEEMGREMALS